TPASVDSIVSSNGQEDHVSMGANAAVQALDVLNNLERILAIELFNASQAMHFREPLKSSEFIESLLSAYREVVPFVSNDRILHNDIEASVDFIRSLNIEMDLLIN
ncbi:MAG: aromatic amino acid lyase, partial [Mangrovimonas sp.]|nr:aromatic amino acid lyase [Mangrovimonas sp.]